MAEAITYETFNPENIIFNDVIKKEKPVKFQRIPISYKYPTGVKKMVIKTPLLQSFGLLTNKDQKTEEITGYSFPFITYDSNEGKTEEQAQFIEMLEKIEKRIQEYCKKESTLKELGRGKRDPINTDKLTILSYKKDDDDAPPVIYAKALTEYNDKSDAAPKIRTPFSRRLTKKEVKTLTKKGKKLPPLNLKHIESPVDDLTKQKALVIGAITIDNIFVGALICAIQKKLKEAIIVKKLDTQKSAFGDGDIPDMSDSDDSNDDDDDEDGAPIPKKKKEIVVADSDEASEDIDEDDMAAFQKLKM
jgi:hypothetical protein